MELTQMELIAGLIAAIGGIIGLPPLWQYLTDRLRINSDSQCQKKINALQLQVSQIVASMAMLLEVIGEDFPNSPGIQKAIKRVKTMLEKIENEPHDEEHGGH